MRLPQHEVEDMLDDLDAEGVAIAVANFNRMRQKREAKRLHEPEPPTSFERWVDSRKGGSGRHRRGD